MMHNKNATVNIKRWTVVFRALANGNRLKIIAMLTNGDRKNVGEIAGALHISVKATSNHLVMLKNLDVVDAEGNAGHVWYRFNSRLPEDFRRAVLLFSDIQKII